MNANVSICDVRGLNDRMIAVLIGADTPDARPLRTVGDVRGATDDEIANRVGSGYWLATKIRVACNYDGPHPPRPKRVSLIQKGPDGDGEYVYVVRATVDLLTPAIGDTLRSDDVQRLIASGDVTINIGGDL